jgi:hypothetical protein
MGLFEGTEKFITEYGSAATDPRMTFWRFVG